MVVRVKVRAAWRAANMVFVSVYVAAGRDVVRYKMKRTKETTNFSPPPPLYREISKKSFIAYLDDISDFYSLSCTASTGRRSSLINNVAASPFEAARVHDTPSAAASQVLYILHQ